MRSAGGGISVHRADELFEDGCQSNLSRGGQYREALPPGIILFETVRCFDLPFF